MKKRLLSLVLCLVMVFSLFPAFGMSAAAADPVDYGANGVITNPDPAQDTSGNLHLTKNLAPGANGTYDITMESWATGEVKTQGITEKIPTDFVLVVDQSGSMSGEKGTDMPVGDPTRQDNKYLEDVAAGRYYYKDGDNYYRVYGVKDYLYRYYQPNYWYTGTIIKHFGTTIYWFMPESDTATTLDNMFYFREVVGGKTYYQPIKTTIQGKVGAYVMYFSYQSKKTGGTVDFNRDDTTYSTNGKSPWYHNVLNGKVLKSGLTWEGANATVQEFYPPDEQYTYAKFGTLKTGMYINYPMYERHIGYTKLCYRDVNGVEHEVPSNDNGQTTWEYCNDSAQALNGAEGSRPTYSGLYSYTGTTSRITALKAALNEFAQAVANETDSFGKVDNKVSIVGFSSPNYSNTELLTHTERDISSGSTNGWQKGTCDNNVSEYYGKGLVGATNGNVGTVNPKITNAITAITANGGTQPEDGLNMAYQVLTNRSNTTYTIRSGEHKDETVDRNTIVIFFTDGQPGDYHYSDQYTKANEVVAQAKQIKDYGKTLDYGTSIFSIGVFGESDGNPLTYTYAQANSESAYWKYDDGYMETYNESGGFSTTYYSLHRWWLAGRDGYPETANDTIYDYMSVVSSNYPDAKNFIAPAWLEGNFNGNYIAATDGDAVRQKSTAEATNKYYRMASNQDTLVAAFLQAVTMNNEEITSDTSVPLNETAIFKDKVNLADFDTTGATYTVKWQPVKEQGGQIVNNGNAETKVNGAAYPADGINYSGFNYSANFVTSAHPGQKLVITINGLTPKKASGTLYSNAGNAGVYGPEDEDPTVSITSPTLELAAGAEYTYVIDFSAPMTVASNVNKFGAKTDHNGDFDLKTGNVTYKLHNINAAVGQTSDLKLSGVDTAMVYLNTSKWNKITTVPASSVYFDDDFTTAIPVGDGSGYNAAFKGENSKYTQNADQNTVQGKYTITFNGTGIDVYCTTDTESGYIQAKVDNTVKTVRNSVNSADHLRYNVPSVSFTCEPGPHTLTLTILGSSKYKLDGIRVYNAIDQAEYDNRGEEAAAEKNASYTNLHELLVNQKEEYTATATVTGGMLFVDDTSKLTKLVNATEYEIENGKDENDNLVKIVYVNENNEVVDASTPGAKPMKAAYSTDYAAYKANSPKNEIYLAQGQGIAFTVKNYYTNLPEGAKVMVGLSTAQNGQTAAITGIKDGSISSAVDMYYELSPERVSDSNGNQTNDALFTIVNPDTNDCVVSVTNLKVSGGDSMVAFSIDGDKAITMSADDDQSAALDAESVELEVFVNEDTVRMASRMMLGAIHVTETPDDPQEPEVTPDPTPAPIETPAPVETPEPTQAPSVHDIVKQIVSSFVSNLFRSISRLFGN